MYWSEQSGPDWSARGGEPARWRDIEEFLASLPPDSLVLDIGCGNGRFLNLVAKKTIDIGVDKSIEQCTLCAKNGHSNVVCGDALILPFIDGTFDHVICIEMIHHCSKESDRIQCLREIGRVMRIGGTALVTSWSAQIAETRESCNHYFEECEFGRLCHSIDGLEVLGEFVRSDGRLNAVFVRI